LEFYYVVDVEALVPSIV